MRRLRLRPVVMVALLALLALPAMAFNLDESNIPSLEDARNIMEYGSILDDPLSRYTKSIDPDYGKEASVDMHVPLPDNARWTGPLGAPATPSNAPPEPPTQGGAPLLGSGVPLTSTGGGSISTRPLDRDSLRRTLEDVNDALGLE